MADTPQTPLPKSSLRHRHKSGQHRPGLLPAGLSDLMPPDARHQAEAIRRLMAGFHRFGYAPVQPPLVEFEESLLAEGPGAALAMMTFRLMDPASSRMMALRADMTAQIARIASTRMAHVPRPLRLSYNGAVLRVKPDPLNPERQLMQLGAEMIGAASPHHDAELAVAALSSLRQAGVERMTIDLGIPRLLDALFDDSAASDTLSGDGGEALIRAVAARDPVQVRALAGDRADILCQIMDLPMTGLGKLGDAIKGLAPILPPGAKAMLDDLLEVGQLISAAAPFAEITIDPLEARGFDYHHGIGFAIFAPGVRGEIGRGGRYRTAAMGGGGEESTGKESTGGESTMGRVGEESTGVTLYLERVLRVMPPLEPETRLYIPHAKGLAALRQQAEAGAHVVFGSAAAKTEAQQAQEAQSLGCSHILAASTPRPLG